MSLPVWARKPFAGHAVDPGPSGPFLTNGGFKVNSIIYIVGLVVVVLFILSLLGLR